MDWQIIVTAATVSAALIALGGYIVKAVHWMDKQKKQDAEISDLKKEQEILVYGVLACLKGLKEQGCNGPVTEAIGRLEKHINAKAHE